MSLDNMEENFTMISSCFDAQTYLNGYGNGKLNSDVGGVCVVLSSTVHMCIYLVFLFNKALIHQI